jgi:hypothetical protein
LTHVLEEFLGAGLGFLGSMKEERWTRGRLGQNKRNREKSKEQGNREERREKKHEQRRKTREEGEEGEEDEQEDRLERVVLVAKTSRRLDSLRRTLVAGGVVLCVVLLRFCVFGWDTKQDLRGTREGREERKTRKAFWGWVQVLRAKEHDHTERTKGPRELVLHHTERAFVGVRR